MTADMESGGVKPALGLSWSDGVTLRLMMTRNEGVENPEDLQQVTNILC